MLGAISGALEGDRCPTRTGSAPAFARLRLRSAEGAHVSKDLVALVSGRPDLHAALTALGEPLEVRETSGGALQLHDAEGRLLVSVEAPSLVEVQGEAERLLGVSAPVPYWWVDVRAAVEPADAVRVAQRLTDGLVRAQGGLVWSGR
jgi:hypothetical protein